MTGRPMVLTLFLGVAVGCGDGTDAPTADAGPDRGSPADGRPDRNPALDLAPDAPPLDGQPAEGLPRPDLSPQPDTSAPPKMKLYFKKPSSWGKANVHYWRTWPNNRGTTWPGKAMTSAGNGWYWFDLSTEQSAGIVFNDGAGQQTVDLYRVGAGYFVTAARTSGKLANGQATQVKWVGRWHDANPDSFPPMGAYPAGGTFHGSKVDVELWADGPGVTERRYTTDGSSPQKGATFANGQVVTVGSGVKVGGAATVRVWAATASGGHSRAFVFTKKVGTTTPVWNPSNKPAGISQSGRWVYLKKFNNNNGLESRDVTLYLPADYASKPKRRYQVVYFHDGQNLFSPSTATYGQEWMVDEHYDELVAEDLIEPAIFVGIHSAKSATTRAYEYVGTSSRDDKPKYASWVINSLKPYIDHHYRTRPQAAFTHTMGSSFGGIISYYLSWNHPSVFGHAACVSTAFTSSSLGGQILQGIQKYSGAKKPVRYWIDGGYKEGTPYTTGRSAYVIWNRSFAEKLGKLGWRDNDDLGLQEVVGGQHNETHWSHRIKQVLYFMLRKEAPRIVHITARTALTSIKVGDSTYASVDIRHENGPLVTKVFSDTTRPLTLTASPSGLVTLDPKTGLVTGKKAGTVTIKAAYRGFSAATKLTVK